MGYAQNGVVGSGVKPRPQAKLLTQAIAGGGSGGVLALIAMIIAPHLGIGEKAAAPEITRAEVRSEVREVKAACDERLDLTVRCLEERMKGVEDKLTDSCRTQRELSRQLTEVLTRLPAVPK